MQSTEDRITKQIYKERSKVENMNEFRIENNKIYSKSGLCEKTDIFEIVDKIPSGFLSGISEKIWEVMNIFHLHRI